MHRLHIKGRGNRIGCGDGRKMFRITRGDFKCFNLSCQFLRREPIRIKAGRRQAKGFILDMLSLGSF